jgi:hypothetical protein
VSEQTYARALKLFRERDLVDFTNLVARDTSDATLLTAFDEHVPAGQKPLLPIP